MSDEAPKEILAERYRLIEKIGQGGMGSVWRAEHTSLRTPVAIKLLNPKLANDASLRVRFLREAQSAAALQSAHIVRILDHGVDGDVPYIAMEFLSGESLRSRLSRDGALPAAAAARVFAGVSRAMARAHRAGIVHRDLKPDNIFMAKDEDLGEVVKVVDFGIAKLVSDAKLLHADDTASLATVTGTVLGTPYYMSPEQHRGKKEIDARSDLWAIGVIAYECVTGKRPFVAEALGELVLTICTKPPPVPSSVATVPAGFDAWFARAVGVEPGNRFQTIQELAKGLSAVLAPTETWLPVEAELLSDPPGADFTPAGATPAGSSPDLFSSDPLATATSALGTGDGKVVTEQKVQSLTGAAHEISSQPLHSGKSSIGRSFGIGAALLVVGAGVFLLGRAGRDVPTPQAAANSAAVAAPAALAPAVSARAVEAAASVAAPPSASAPSSATAAASSASAAPVVRPPIHQPAAPARPAPSPGPSPTVNLGI